MNRRELLRASLCAPFVASLPRTAGAADWPNREISVIQPVGPGGGGDIAARTWMTAMQQSLGVPMISKNLPGAAGALALRELVDAKPDGYTMSTIGIPSHVILAHTTNLGFDPMEATSILAQTWTSMFGIAVSAKSEIQSIADLVALGKKRRVNYSSPLVSMVVANYKLAALTGADLNWVRTATTHEAVTQLVGGHVDAAVLSNSDIVPMSKAGTLRMLAATGKSRFPDLPEIPTLLDLGYDAYTTSMIGWAFPKGVPEEIRQRVETLMGEIAKDQEVVKKTNAVGLAVEFKTGAEFRKDLEAHSKEIYPILVQAGMVK